MKKSDEKKIVKGLNQFAYLLNRAITRNKKILFIMGAGASYSAEVPLMKDVYKCLSDSVNETLSKLPEDQNSGAEKKLLEDLSKWLGALKTGAPRSIASLALGTLQKAEERSLVNIAKVWHDFSLDFISGKINHKDNKQDNNFSKFINNSKNKILGKVASDDSEYHKFCQFNSCIKEYKRIWEIADKCIKEDIKNKSKNTSVINKSPTLFHYFVASLVRGGWAHAVSLNFDGLTKKALNNILEKEYFSVNNKAAAVVLNDYENIKAFYTSENREKSFLFPVIKIWGDVFHAVCKNPRCPEHEKRIPIFELSYDDNDDSQIENLICDSCRCRRQLEIYFTGYEKKEENTKAILDGIIEFMSSEIDGIVSAGFSGLWDPLMVELICTILKKITQHYSLEKDSAPNFLCIDPLLDTENKYPFLIRELSRKGIKRFGHINATTDQVASLFDGKICFEKNKKAEKWEVLNSDTMKLPDNRWDDLYEDKYKQDRKTFPATYQIIQANHSAIDPLTNLQQLGLKTQISQNNNQTGNQIKKVRNHSRFYHSLGTVHLASMWLYHLNENCKKRNNNRAHFDLFRNTGPVAALLHDIGHIPFTHSAEEIFEEVSWSLKTWGKPFKHDDPVLFSVSDEFSELDKMLEELWEKSNLKNVMSLQQYRGFLESIIQGHSGQPWLDAIINSPLDVDKLDYVFRDCFYLEQSLHIPIDQQIGWMEKFFSNTRILSSGLLALEAEAGDCARNFLEERYWLYKNQYVRKSFRALERLAHSVIIKWLIWGVNNSLGFVDRNLSDTRQIKGECARKLLWSKLMQLRDHGTLPMEPSLLIKICNDLLNKESNKSLKEFKKRIPMHKNAIKWIEDCYEIFKQLKMGDEAQSKIFYSDFKEVLREKVEYSDCLYVPVNENLKKVREIIRRLELERPYKALGDIAIPPAVLSYPSGKKTEWFGKQHKSECIVVAHKDPDRWGIKNNQWVPLSSTHYADIDNNRWAKIMFVAPSKPCADVWLMLDRFRHECYHYKIPIRDADPNRTL